MKSRHRQRGQDHPLGPFIHSWANTYWNKIEALEEEVAARTITSPKLIGDTWAHDEQSLGDGGHPPVPCWSFRSSDFCWKSLTGILALLQFLLLPLDTFPPSFSSRCSVCVHAHTHTHMCTCIYTYIHIHVHMREERHFYSQSWTGRGNPEHQYGGDSVQERQRGHRRQRAGGA